MEANRYDALLTMRLRPQFYRKLYRGLLKVVFINSAILGTLGILTAYLCFSGVKPEHYYATSGSGHLLELHYRKTAPYIKQPSAESSHGQPNTSPAKTR